MRILMLSRGVMASQQDGNKHYLLCEKCEQAAAVAESYCRDIAVQDHGNLRRQNTRHLFFDWYWHLRVDLISEFIAISALRAHYSQSVPVSNTSLPPDVRKTLRRIVFNGYETAGVIVAAWRFLPPKANPSHDPREDIYETFGNGELGRFYLMQAGGLEWMLSFDPTLFRNLIGLQGFQGRGIERIVRLGYDQHRQFKYPERWLEPLRDRMKNAS